MKKSTLFRIVLFMLLGASLLSACGTEANVAGPVVALVDSDGAAATNEPAPVVAPVANAPVESVDVAASLDATAPSRIEFPVSNDKMEIQIVVIKKPTSVDLSTDPISGSDLLFKPGAGKMFLDIGIKVTNKTGSDLNFKWSDISLVNKFQDKYYPSWGVYNESDIELDPLLMEINKYDRIHPDFDPDAHFYMGEDGFVRILFLLPRSNLYYYFGFGDLPVIEIKNEYY